MKYLDDIEVLAELENFRLKKQNTKDPVDFVLRVASAIVANAMGYPDRATWVSDLKKANLVSYGGTVEDEMMRAEAMDDYFYGKARRAREREHETDSSGRSH